MRELDGGLATAVRSRMSVKKEGEIRRWSAGHLTVSAKNADSARIAADGPAEERAVAGRTMGTAGRGAARWYCCGSTNRATTLASIDREASRRRDHRRRRSGGCCFWASKREGKGVDGAAKMDGDDDARDGERRGCMFDGGN